MHLFAAVLNIDNDTFSPLGLGVPADSIVSSHLPPCALGVAWAGETWRSVQSGRGLCRQHRAMGCYGEA